MFESDLTRMDAATAVDHAVACRDLAERCEVEILATAAHYADLHGVLESAAGSGRALPGAERLVALGGAGTPRVAEFAPAELGAALRMSDTAAAILIGDGLDLRHRLPLLWARLQAGEVRAWVGRKVAQATRTATLETVAVVDRRVAPFAGRLSWGRLEPVVQAAMIEADPQAAEAETGAVSEQSTGVFRSRESLHGVVTTVLRTEVPDAVKFEAAVDRVATGLALLGDDRAAQVRRASAVGVIADPQQALDVYDAAADAAERLRATGGDKRLRSLVGVDPPLDSDAPQTPADPTLDAPESPAPRHRRHRSDRRDSRDREAGRRRSGPAAVLYVHLTDRTLDTGRGVARVEDVGPVVAGRVKGWLDHADRVIVKPVIDIAGQPPVDGYEIPQRIREAVHLMAPTDCFPYAGNQRRGLDLDHTEPWSPVEGGGPPGQTRVGNLGKLTRRHHRIKTHHRWQVTQPLPGIWLWRSPLGRHYLVDHTGTTALGSGPPSTA